MTFPATAPKSSPEETEVRRLIQADQLFEALKKARQIYQGNRLQLGHPFLYGFALQCIGRHEEALDAYKEELTINPTHAEARARHDQLVPALAKPAPALIPTDERSYQTSLPRPTLLTLQQSLHNSTYRGVPMLKNPFDQVLYHQLLWKLKPRTIFEIGSKSGGSALWMGDLMDNFGIDGHIHSLDVVRVDDVSHPRVTFWEGDGRDLAKSFTPDFLEKMPRPWLVIEDADHAYPTSIAVLNFFHPWLKPDEIIVVEDGIISDLEADPDCNSGPHRALKEFLPQHADEYEMDPEYCDFFGYNMTWCTNGWLKKKSPAAPLITEDLPAIEKLIESGEIAKAQAALTRIKAERIPHRNVDFLRARCFMALSQKEAAFEAVKEELRYFPDHAEATAMLENLEARVAVSEVKGPEEFQQIFHRISRYTMLSPARLLSLYELAKNVCAQNLSGQFVECGVAGGGSSGLLASVIDRHSQQPRRLFSCDTFCGLPDTSEHDKHGTDTPDSTGWGAGTCAAPIDSLREICNELGAMQHVEPVEGLFADTLPKIREKIGPIAFLHMDGDWYSSTRDILENLFDQVVEGGAIQIDDYGYWEGCAKAIREFEIKHGLRFDLHDIDGTGVWMIKNTASTSPRLLNLGCGTHFHASWTNVDIVPAHDSVLKHDLLTRLPFDDASFAAVYHSHVLEHLTPGQAWAFIKECHRVLQSGGTLRIAVPDLETITRLYLQNLDDALAGNEEAAARHEWMTVELIDQVSREQGGGEMLKFWERNPLPAEDFVISRMGREVKHYLEANQEHRAAELTSGRAKAERDFEAPQSPADPLTVGQFRLGGEVHKWMYDRLSLRRLLDKCGFSGARICSAAESSIPDFSTYQLDASEDGAIRKPDSLFMEAIKI